MCVQAHFNPSKPVFSLALAQAVTLMSYLKTHSHYPPELHPWQSFKHFLSQCYRSWLSLHAALSSLSLWVPVIVEYCSIKLNHRFWNSFMSVDMYASRDIANCPQQIVMLLWIVLWSFFVIGEPIMYPRINELIRILHGHDISTFLVTNAQFPDAIR